MKAPSVARCALALLAVRALLKTRGFGPSVTRVRGWGERVAGDGLPPEEMELDGEPLNEDPEIVDRFQVLAEGGS